MSAWRSVAAAVAAGVLLGCTEQIGGPGECPELCPTEGILVEDTLLTGIVTSDTSDRGFTTMYLSSVLVSSTDPAARSVAVVRFVARPFIIFKNADTTRYPVEIDSLQLELRLLARDTAAHNLKLLIYRLRWDLDSLDTWDSLVPFFHDSMLVDTIAIEDTTVFTTLRDTIPWARVMPDSAVDSGVVALAVLVTADQPTSVTLAASNLTGTPPRMRWFAHAPAPEDTVKRTFDLTPTFDTFVQEFPPGPPPSNAITVGNLPAARSLLRFSLPRSIVDSTTIIRATLLLTPVSPPTGRPGEIFDVSAVPILRDFAGKSILIPDSTVSGLGTVTTGSTDTVAIEIGRVLRFWRATGDSLQRALVLRNALEDNTLGELRVARAGTGAAAPRLRVTFIRPYRFGVP